MKKILITGATDGIGFATAKLLAKDGHHLLIHGRSESKLHDVENELKNSYSQAVIESYLADLSVFSDIDLMLRSVLNVHQSIDIIINNAGVFKTPNAITGDGLDIRFVVNTCAPYIITKALLPFLADDGRIINLSSAAQAPVSVEAMLGKIKIVDAFQAYAQSKLALTIWSAQLVKLLKPEQVVIAVNPGSMLASKMVHEGFGVLGSDVGIGADVLVKSALSDEFSHASGAYFDNDTKQFTTPHPDAHNQHKCDQVMAALEAIVTTYYGNLGAEQRY